MCLHELPDTRRIMSTTKPKLTRYTCAQCGKQLREGYVYSRFTGNRYCPALTCKPRRAKKDG